MSLRFQYGTAWSSQATASAPVPKPSSPLQQEVEAPIRPVLAAFEVIEIQASDDGTNWSNLAINHDRSQLLQSRPVWRPNSEPKPFARAVRPMAQASVSQHYSL